jgi:hypothetical protein
VAIKGKSCILALPYSNITFCATFVKLYLTPTTKIEDIRVKFTSKKHITKEFAGALVNKELMPLLVKSSRGKLHKNTNIIIYL